MSLTIDQGTALKRLADATEHQALDGRALALTVNNNIRKNPKFYDGVVPVFPHHASDCPACVFYAAVREREAQKAAEAAAAEQAAREH